jgi:Mg2+ and Co2+ transporter CorA
MVKSLMIWMYAVKKKELYSADVPSLDVLKDFKGEADWLWIDCLTPDEKELEIISELLGGEKAVVSGINEGTYNILHLYTNFEKVNDCTLISIPYVEVEKELSMHPLFMIVKDQMLLTWGCEHWPKLMKTVIATVKDHVNNGLETNQDFIISRLFREVSAKNSRVIVAFKESIDKVEEHGLEKSGRKMVHSVFQLKKQISTLNRLLYLGQELMCDAKEGIIPRVHLNEGDAKLVIDDAINDTNREAELLDSHDRALDSFLTLLSLGAVHRVESSINYLTIILVILTVILVVLELASRLSGSSSHELVISALSNVVV